MKNIWLEVKTQASSKQDRNQANKKPLRRWSCEDSPGSSNSLSSLVAFYQASKSDLTTCGLG